MNSYTWRPAAGEDIGKIVAMAQSHFQTEIDSIFKPEPYAYSRNITFAVVNQFYNPNGELLSVAVDSNNELIAYTWAKSGERAPWSDDEMMSVKMAHVSLDLTARLRIRLIQDMMSLWEEFAERSKVKIIVSTTMRREQDAFLKLHVKAGYDVRGSYAYKRVSA